VVACICDKRYKLARRLTDDNYCCQPTKVDHRRGALRAHLPGRLVRFHFDEEVPPVREHERHVASCAEGLGVLA
jgi:hypothetical protein